MSGLAAIAPAAASAGSSLFSGLAPALGSASSGLGGLFSMLGGGASGASPLASLLNPKTGAPMAPQGFFDMLSQGMQKTMENPLWKLGMGLMEQGGPSMQAHSFGQDLSRASGGMQKDQDTEEERRYQREKRAAEMQQMKEQQRFMAQAQPTILDALQGGAYGQPPKPNIAPPVPGAVPRYPPGYSGR